MNDRKPNLQLRWSQPVEAANSNTLRRYAPAPPGELGFMFSDGHRIVVELQFNPLHVKLTDGVEWDHAARSFWNAVARAAGQPFPFPFPDRD